MPLIVLKSNIEDIVIFFIGTHTMWNSIDMTSSVGIATVTRWSCGLEGAIFELTLLCHIIDFKEEIVGWLTVVVILGLQQLNLSLGEDFQTELDGPPSYEEIEVSISTEPLVGRFVDDSGATLLATNWKSSLIS